MLTTEQNELLTRTAPGTPGGDLFRRYWQPVALSEELSLEPLTVRLLSEDLMVRRNGSDDPELAGVSHKYPCRDVAGLILAYLGPGEPPPIPPFPFVDAPLSSVWTGKMLNGCNYLQGNEGNVDPQHLSFLHRLFRPVESDRAYDPSRPLWAADPAPRIEVEETPWGLRVCAIRQSGADEQYVRISNFIMPNCSSFLGAAVVDPQVERIPENSYYHFHWHVPIDDVSHWKYRIAYRTDGPVDKAYLAALSRDGMDEGYNRVRRRENRYLQDRDEMKTRTFAGLGTNFQDHDRFAVESQGPIADRTREHLGATDRAVTAMRRQMLRAIDDLRAGKAPPPLTFDGFITGAKLVAC